MSYINLATKLFELGKEEFYTDETNKLVNRENMIEAIAKRCEDFYTRENDQNELEEIIAITKETKSVEERVNKIMNLSIEYDEEEPNREITRLVERVIQLMTHLDNVYCDSEYECIQEHIRNIEKYVLEIATDMVINQRTITYKKSILPFMKFVKIIWQKEGSTRLEHIRLCTQLWKNMSEEEKRIFQV